MSEFTRRFSSDDRERLFNLARRVSPELGSIVQNDMLLTRDDLLTELRLVESCLQRLLSYTCEYKIELRRAFEGDKQ
jgi:hypothetical protein